VWLPLILYFLEGIRIRGDIRSALVASLAVVLQVYAGHPQISFYSYIVIFMFLLHHALPHGNGPRFLAVCALTVLLGLVMGSPQLYATYELSSMGVRSGMEYKEFASFPLSFQQLPLMVFPMIFGRSEAYFSIAALLLAALALMKGFRGNPHIRFWGIVALITFVLALGDTIGPLHRVMFHVPLYNLFRGSVRHLVVLNLCISVLSAFGISLIVEGKKAGEGMRALLVLLSVMLGGLVIYSLVGEDSWLSRPPALMALSAMAAAGACLVILHLRGKHGFLKYLAVIALVAEVISFRVSEWSSMDNVEKYVPKELSILGAGNFRTAFNIKKMIPYLFIKYDVDVLTAYDPMVIEDFAILHGMGGVGGVPIQWKRLVRNNLILSMSNTRYIFVPSSYVPEMKKIKATGWKDGSWGRPVIQPLTKPGYDPLYRELHIEKDIALYENLNVMSRAYSVTRLVPVKHVQDVWAVFYSRDVNPREVATVPQDELREIGIKDFAKGEVSIASYDHDRVVLNANFSGLGFLVLSDQYYPGWRAYIDGEETKIYKANGIMRGLVVPEGAHEVVFEYFPLRIYLLMVLGALTLSGVCIAIIFRRKG
jgi:hypothetical protein